MREIRKKFLGFQIRSINDLHLAERILILAARKPSDGNSRGISSHHLLTAELPHLKIEASLDDAK